MPGFEVFGEEEKKEISDVLDTGILFRYGFEKERKRVWKVAEFERRFASMCGASYSLAVSSGSAALRVALAALGVSPGDEVITQGFTFIATWEAIIESGATPVFTEVDDTLCMEPADLEKKVTERTKAIIPVHMIGAQANIKEIMTIANRHGIPVIEDTAQAAGGTFDGNYLGTFGAMGTFSFDPVKTITTGEGAMIITNEKDLYLNCSAFHDHGHEHLPDVERGLDNRRFLGFNFRMMELQGAIGLAQLAKLPFIIREQKKNKERIKKTLQRIEGITFRRILDPDGDTATFLAFFLPDAQKARRFNQVLSKNNAGAIYYKDNTWHFYPNWQELFKGNTLCKSGWPFKNNIRGVDLVYQKDVLPKTDALFQRLLVYPISVKMPEERLAYMINAIEAAAREVF
jgi:8-amino-3,8-dideoxy-alpha-D-manno-octulosonate transaminase